MGKDVYKPKGAALGYGISPRWGWKNANERIIKPNGKNY